MKASKKIVALSVFCLMIFNTVSVFAADRDVWEKATDTKFATRMEMRQDKNKRLAVRQRPNDYYFEANGHLFEMKKMYEEFAKDELNFVTKLVKGNSDVKPVPADELKVVSVSAINAKKVKVVFGKPIYKEDAEKTANYTVAPAGVNVTNAKLQEDEKTVIVTLNNSISEKTILFTVKPMRDKVDITKKTDEKVEVLNFVDKEAPKYLSVEYTMPGAAVLTFSEELENAVGTLKVFDGVVETAIVPAISPKDASKVEISGLEKDKEYKAVFVGLKDKAGNMIAPNPTEVMLQSTVEDTEKPMVVKMEAEGDQKVIVTFSEQIKEATIKLDVNGGNDGAIVATLDEKDKTKVNIKLSAAQTGVKAIKVYDFEDFGGNKGKEKVVNLAFKAEDLEVKAVKVLAVGADYDLEVVTNKDLKAVIADLAGKNLTGTYLTLDNVSKTLTYDLKKGGANKVTLKRTNIANDTAVVRVTPMTDLEPGDYKAKLPKDIFNPNLAEDIEFEFKVEAATEYLPLPTTGAITSKKVELTYTKAMNAAAAQKESYTVNGVSIFEKAYFKDANKKVIVLEVKKGAIIVDGALDVAIDAGVAAQEGSVIKPGANKVAVEFKESVSPTILSAQLMGQKIEVTFSENVTTTTPDKVEVYVGGVKVASTDVVIAGQKKLVVNLTAALEAEDLEKDIKIKVLEATGAKDGNDNLLEVPVDFPVAK